MSWAVIGGGEGAVTVVAREADVASGLVAVTLSVETVLADASDVVSDWSPVQPETSTSMTTTTHAKPSVITFICRTRSPIVSPCGSLAWVQPMAASTAGRTRLRSIPEVDLGIDYTLPRLVM